MRKVIIYLTIKYKGDWQDIYNAIKRKEKPDSDFEEIINKVNDNVITILDKDYPKVFSSLLRPPFVIFYKGDISLLSKKIISVIGSRNPPSYAINSLKEVIKDIAPVVLSISDMSGKILEPGEETTVKISAIYNPGQETEQNKPEKLSGKIGIITESKK